MNIITFGDGSFEYYETLAGGAGVYRGGDGLIRHYRFPRGVQVSLLTQRRETAPYGLEGGKAGERGGNWRVTPQGDNIPGRPSVNGMVSHIPHRPRFG